MQWVYVDKNSSSQSLDIEAPIWGAGFEPKCTVVLTDVKTNLWELSLSSLLWGRSLGLVSQGWSGCSPSEGVPEWGVSCPRGTGIALYPSGGKYFDFQQSSANVFTSSQHMASALPVSLLIILPEWLQMRSRNSSM